MPHAAPRACPRPGCGGVCEGRGPCQACQRAAQRARGTSAQRGYGAAWQRLRAAVLAVEPLCRACAAQGRTQAATDLDHVLPREQGGTDELSNLQPLCHSCHSAKTATQDGGFRGRRGAAISQTSRPQTASQPRSHGPEMHGAPFGGTP